MNRFKDISLLVLTLILLVFICLNVKQCKQPNNIIIKDKVIIEHHRDTIFARDTLYTFKYIKIPIPSIDTIIKPIYIDSTIYNKVFIYKDSLVDSNLIIYYKDYIQGILRSKELSYKLKVPIIIYDSTKETIKINPKFALYGTLVVSKGIISPMGEIALKRFKISLGYNFINNSPIFGFSYKLIEK